MKKQVKVRVPATTANCGPGFDTIGIACGLYNYLELELTDEREVNFDISGEGSRTLPVDERNIVYRALQKVLKETGFPLDQGIKFTMINNIPLSRGLGSSAAAVVAGLLAGNALTGNIWNIDKLLEVATMFEGHPDNVAPALMGGIVVSVMDNDQVSYLRFMPAKQLLMVVAVPEFTLPTKAARQVLPKKVSMHDAIYNISRSSLLTAALMTGRWDLLPTALQDRLHQPYREKLIPGMTDVFAAAQAVGASGTVISGAGSCLMAFVNPEKVDGDEVGKAMVKAFDANSVSAYYRVLSIDSDGAQVEIL